MDSTVFVLVLAAAALHAGWNALLKIGLDRYLTASLIQIGAACVALPALPFFSLPQPVAWPFIAFSALLHVGYNLFQERDIGPILNKGDMNAEQFTPAALRSAGN